MNKTFILILAIIVVIIGLFFLLSPNKEVVEEKIPENTSSENWRDIELKDALTGKNFSIKDFEGKSVLMESFAVWCPTCLKQQKEISKLKNEDIIHIALNVDPNEDENKVIEHANKHGFDWLFAVSPKNFTQSLIDEFGVNVVNAPSAPVILICEDSSARFLDNGVKSSEDLRQEVEKGCSI